MSRSKGQRTTTVLPRGGTATTCAHRVGEPSTVAHNPTMWRQMRWFSLCTAASCLPSVWLMAATLAYRLNDASLGVLEVVNEGGAKPAIINRALATLSAKFSSSDEKNKARENRTRCLTVFNVCARRRNAAHVARSFAHLDYTRATAHKAHEQRIQGRRRASPVEA